MAWFYGGPHDELTDAQEREQERLADIEESYWESLLALEPVG